MFADLELAVDWSAARPVATGVRLEHFTLPNPQLAGDVMRIDLRTKGLRFHATEADPRWGEPIPGYPHLKVATRTERVRDFMSRLRKEGLNVVAAVNTAVWTPFPATNGCRLVSLMGTAVSHGKVIHGAGHPAVFSVRRDGTAAITRTLDVSDISGIELATAGFALLLDGKGGFAVGTGGARHPRTAFGLSQDGRYLYWLTVDGRQPGHSVGATCHELAELLRSLGCASGMNMDGGGSTTLCYWDRESGKPVQASHSTSQDPAVARAVAFSVAISVE